MDILEDLPSVETINARVSSDIESLYEKTRSVMATIATLEIPNTDAAVKITTALEKAANILSTLQPLLRQAVGVPDTPAPAMVSHSYVVVVPSQPANTQEWLARYSKPVITQE
ncbi:MAG: hypothetical protein AB7F19_07795 [Candidatus Babeliales bacterium]